MNRRNFIMNPDITYVVQERAKEDPDSWWFDHSRSTCYHDKTVAILCAQNLSTNPGYAYRVVQRVDTQVWPKGKK